MSDYGSQRISVRSDPLKNLIVSVERGEYRIPQFQRDFVWETSKVITLFDSIYQEYPIGSFFLWKSSRDQNRLFRHAIHEGIPEIKDDDDVFFILDGQQRITSLYVALKGLILQDIDYSRICFDCKEECFTNRTPDNTRYVSVSDIWGANAMRLALTLSEENRDAYMRCWERLQTYPVSLVIVSDMNLESVCKIFRRINQSGKRLGRFDLIAAMTYDPAFDLRKRFQQDIAAKLESQAFGSISNAIATQLLALKIKGSCTDTMQYSLTAEEIRGSWDAVVNGILLAVHTLRTEFGVKTSTYLPYEALLALVAYYFCASSHRSIQAAHMGWFQMWFWRACFSQHYGSGGLTRIGRDKTLIDQVLAGESPEFNPSFALSVEDLIGTRMTWSGSAIRNAFLCLLAKNEPRHLLNNSKIDLVNGGITGFTSPEKHHIFPKSLPEEIIGGSEAHALPNFCFIPAELNKVILASKPSEYFAAFRKQNADFDSALASHLIPFGTNTGIENNDYLMFLRARAQLILDEIQRLCGISLAPRVGERQQAVEKAEKKVREFIHIILSEAVGPEYWGSAVPGDIQESVNGRISDELKRNPELRKEDVRRPQAMLTFCDVADYLKIISMKQNWEHFEPYFRRRSDVERHLEAFRNYRNHVAHGRQLSDLVRIGGEYALTWLKTVLPQEGDLRTEEDE